MKPIICYKNVFDSTVVATDTDSGDYNAAFVADLRPFTRWKAASSGTKYLTMPTTVSTADSLAIRGHNLGTAAATVSLESSHTNAWVGEEVVRLAGFVPTDDYSIFKELDSSVPDGHYVRLKIVTAAVAPELGVLLVGEMLQFPDWPDAPMTPANEQLNAITPKSKGGHHLGSTEYFSPVQHRASFTDVVATFVFGDFLDFWRNHGRSRKPFFWIPNLTEFPEEINFVTFPSSFTWGWPMSDTTYVDRVILLMEGSNER